MREKRRRPKEKHKNKSGYHNPRFVSSLLRETERRAMMASGDNNSFAARITAFASNLVTRLVLLVLRMTRRLLALFIPATILVCAPILIVLILVIGACGAEMDEEEEYVFRQAYTSTATATDAVIAPDAVFVWPACGQYYITSTFGPRWGTIHRGLDIGAPTGTQIVAGADGTVVAAQFNDSMGYYVLIDHGEGVQTYYMHNSVLVAKTGDTVKAGQLIAYSGSTGDSTGPHCHFGVKINGTFVNPAPYLGLPENVADGTDVSLLITGD